MSDRRLEPGELMRQHFTDGELVTLVELAARTAREHENGAAEPYRRALDAMANPAWTHTLGLAADAVLPLLDDQR